MYIGKSQYAPKQKSQTPLSIHSLLPGDTPFCCSFVTSVGEEVCIGKKLKLMSLLIGTNKVLCCSFASAGADASTQASKHHPSLPLSVGSHSTNSKLLERLSKCLSGHYLHPPPPPPTQPCNPLATYCNSLAMPCNVPQQLPSRPLLLLGDSNTSMC